MATCLNHTSIRSLQTASGYKKLVIDAGVYNWHMRNPLTTEVCRKGSATRALQRNYIVPLYGMYWILLCLYILS